MADYSDIPIIGPILPFVGLGSQPKYTPKRGTLAGRTRTVDIRNLRTRAQRPGSRPPLTPEQEAYYDEVAQMSYENQLGVYLGEIAFGVPDIRAPNLPIDPGPLPDPILDTPPIVVSPPNINLPVDLPEVIVSPPSGAPVTPAEPAPIEVPIQEVVFDPYGLPNVLPGARPGSAPATSSPPRVNPPPASNPFPGNLLGIGSAFALASVAQAAVARNASALPKARARPVTPTQPRAPVGPSPSLPPGSGFDLVTPVSPSIVQPTPGLKFAVNPASNPSPQQQTNKDKCRCDEKEKKKSKPREARTKCFRGTFRQRARGISYSRGEEIPCDGPIPKAVKKKPTVKGVKDRALKAAGKYAKRGKVPKLGDLARDVLGF